MSNITTYPGLVGCRDISQIPPDYPNGAPVYLDPSNQKCYPFNGDGRVVYYANYDYNPGFGTGLAFTILFAAVTIVHIVFTVTSRRWWLFVTVFGGVGEIIGWIGRTLSGKNNSASVVAGNYFLVQIVCLTITPAFFSGTVYGLFTMLMRHMNPAFARFKPKFYVILFVALDIISLVIQAIGGAKASEADTSKEQKDGANIMVGGIAFQLGAMIIFSILALDYYFRVHRSGSPSLGNLPRNIKIISISMAVASFLIILRGIYRTAELAQGWRGHLITHEGFFLGLDAVPMLLCMIALAAGHPAVFPPETDHLADAAGVDHEKGLATGSPNEAEKASRPPSV